MKTKKMKRSSIICTYMLAAVFLLGCENEIPYHPGSHKPLLIMNALLTAGEAETMYICTSAKATVSSP